MEAEFGGHNHAYRLTELFTDYGDFNVMRCSKHAIFVEFFAFNPEIVKTENCEELIQILQENKENLRIREVRKFEDADKFVATF